MLDLAQRKRLEELQAIEILKPDEAEELAKLEQLEPEDPNQDEFNAGWDELEGIKPDVEKIQEDQDAQLEKDKDESQSTENVDGDILNTDAPADSDTKPDSTDDGNTDPRDAQITELTETVKQLTHNMKSWEGRLKAADKRAAEAEQKLKDAKAKGQDTSEKVSPEEDDAELGKFFKEYPDLEGPIKKVAEKMATKIFDDKIGDKIETLETNQAQAEELSQEEADRIHMEKINTAHPDWEKIFDSGALHTWIEKQPGYLQPRLTDIIKNGSAQEVIDMFDSYKRAAGKGKETTTNSTEADLKKKEKAKAIEAVPASSGGPKKGQVKITKDDFDGAWDDLEKKDKAKEK
jgi:hypothetical protein